MECGKLEGGTYSVKLLYTKLSPPTVHGRIPRIGRKKLLEKLGKYGLDERMLDRFKQDDGSYAIPLFGGDYLLIIKLVRRMR